MQSLRKMSRVIFSFKIAIANLPVTSVSVSVSVSVSSKLTAAFEC